jgi:signal transduction histidine kinase
VDRLKDELVALVTHELRNPIASISGYVELLRDDDGGLDEQRRRFVSAIARQSSHLQRLVDDLLELARIDAGQVHIEPRPTSLTRLVCEAVDNHRRAADARGLTVHNVATRPFAVVGDPFRLRQVLDNLLSNAIKYSTAGGTVTISAAQRGSRVALTIADTGIGIPADEYPKLFTRFFRASTAVAGNVEGTGLGLAITKAIVERHGGTITAGPNADGGTFFTVELPAATSTCVDR